MSSTLDNFTIISKDADKIRKSIGNEYIHPEHILLVMLDNEFMSSQFEIHFIDVEKLKSTLESYLDRLDKLPTEELTLSNTAAPPPFEIHDSEILSSILSYQTVMLLRELLTMQNSDNEPMEWTMCHLLGALMSLNNNYASSLLMSYIGDRRSCRSFYQSLHKATYMKFGLPYYDYDLDDDESPTESSDEDSSDIGYDGFGSMFSEGSDILVGNILTLMNQDASTHPTLIGREMELERTIEVLCRKDKNNPLHIGEAGVGKTALVWGLVQRIVSGDVPVRLQGCKVYSLDLSSLLAKSQYRGEMEKNLTSVFGQLLKEDCSIIVYIDNIHNMVGVGRSNDSQMDATDVLKPYMDDNKIRFIGSTSFDEYKRSLERLPSISRRFQTIDIPEPSIEESIKIMKSLQPSYESFHGVTYSDDAIEFAVRGSSKYMTSRYLPDKAIDLIDEAGARHEVHSGSCKEIGKQEIAEILSKLSKVGTVKMDEDSESAVANLGNRILENIYGQDDAVSLVTESIQMSKAGLSDEHKPLSSLLFVGPTGVGKTELARVLSRELGVELIRFDMSEYTEKHTVAKLIGSPAGYVGYEDGGLLTDAVRRNPSCVLLLDEIEKAHDNIYNILLQVMDYATLTDNRGQKTDFRNVVLIMTSNAGAQYAGQASVGFNSHVSRSSAMLSQVKKVFKPEFLNRLTSIVAFNDMDREMASRILRKKLSELDVRLSGRNVVMELESDAFDFLLSKGYSSEYGAREMDRAIGQYLKPLLMRGILFGSLKNGGKAIITKKEDGLSVK